MKPVLRRFIDARNRPSALSLVAALLIASHAARAAPQLLVGSDASGTVRNAPADWPASAGRWNGKGARFHAASRKLVFETFREDIRGGSVIAPPGAARFPGVNRYFVAGSETGSADVDGTTVLYVANADGSSPYCLGCVDIRDGENGVAIYRAIASSTDTPATPERQRNATVYANQNKDLAAWHPAVEWILAAVEMPRHGLSHHLGNGELGMFNDLWAIAVDGKTWVQLTDFAASWTHADTVVHLPFQCADSRNCAAGCQYATPQQQHP